ncbi:MAG: hypothetical protein NVSMB38_13260 [Ktedonobacteraceae bacterium]
MALSPDLKGLVLGRAPGCVYPLMVVLLAVSLGKGLNASGVRIVQTATPLLLGLHPGSVDGIWKAMVSPEPAAFA